MPKSRGSTAENSCGRRAVAPAHDTHVRQICSHHETELALDTKDALPFEQCRYKACFFAKLVRCVAISWCFLATFPESIANWEPVLLVKRAPSDWQRAKGANAPLRRLLQHDLNLPKLVKLLETSEGRV